MVVKLSYAMLKIGLNWLLFPQRENLNHITRVPTWLGLRNKPTFKLFSFLSFQDTKKTVLTFYCFKQSVWQLTYRLFFCIKGPSVVFEDWFWFATFSTTVEVASEEIFRNFFSCNSTPNFQPWAYFFPSTHLIIFNWTHSLIYIYILSPFFLLKVGMINQK